MEDRSWLLLIISRTGAGTRDGTISRGGTSEEPDDRRRQITHPAAFRSMISARCNEVTYFLMIEAASAASAGSLTPNCHGNCSTVVKSKYTVRRNGRIPLTPNVSKRDCSYSRVKISVERTVGRVGKIRERLSIGEKV